jgi:hypothetical protein
MTDCHNITALISSSGVLTSGCLTWHHMIGTQLFPQPQPAPGGKQSVQLHGLFAKGAYSKETTQPRCDSLIPRYLTDNQALLQKLKLPYVLKNFPTLMLLDMALARSHYAPLDTHQNLSFLKFQATHRSSSLVFRVILYFHWPPVLSTGPTHVTRLDE